MKTNVYTKSRWALRSVSGASLLACGITLAFAEAGIIERPQERQLPQQQTDLQSVPPSPRPSQALFENQQADTDDLNQTMEPTAAGGSLFLDDEAWPLP